MKINKIKIYNIKLSNDKEDMISDDLVRRIMKYKDLLKEVEKTELSEIIKDFNNDMYPEIEITIWEVLADKYESLIKNKVQISIEEKEKIFKDLLSESFGE